MAFYDSMKLEKGMYAVGGKTFTQVLEELDPSQQYERTELAGLDAYQRQLKRFDIKVGGENSDTVERFFQNSDSAALFPEYVNRAVRQGMERANQLPGVIATVTRVDGMDYRTITAAAAAAAEQAAANPAATAEGAELPKTTITNQKTLVSLKKRGRLLVSSYEALRFHKLDLFTVTLRQIGAEIARELLGDAVDVLVKGDGNSNALTPTNLSAKPTYADLVGLWASVAPYELNTMLVSTATMKDVLAISELQDATAGLNFQGTGKLSTPLGANLIHVPSLTDKMIVGLDKNCALEMVQAGDIMTDYDKLIDRQMERAAISTIVGFSRIFPDAVKAVKYA